MNFEKKLIACSILALIIGVSSVLPLMFLMSATAKADASSEPWFSIDIPYAYVMTSNESLIYTDSEMVNMFNETEMVSEQHLIALNLTLDVNTTNEDADARIEYYQIDVSSDKGFIKTLYWYVGTKVNSSFSFSTENFHFMRDEWFDTDWFDAELTNETSEGSGLETEEGVTVTIDALSLGGGGLMRPNWTAGISVIWPNWGSASGTIGGSISSRLVSAIREADTLYLTIRRIGWVTFTGNSTEVMLANNELVDQIQLEKFGDGFLYNTLVPEEELSTIDLLHPVSFKDLPP
jgi:hypothetical protein